MQQCYKNFYSEGESSQVDLYGMEWPVRNHGRVMTEDEEKAMCEYLDALFGAIKTQFSRAIDSRAFIYADSLNSSARQERGECIIKTV